MSSSLQQSNSQEALSSYHQEQFVSLQSTQGSSTNLVMDDVNQNIIEVNIMEDQHTQNAPSEGNEDVDEEQCDNPFERRKRKKTSKVSDEFKIIEVNGTKKVQCTHCSLKFTYSKNGTTTQFQRHLKSCKRRQSSVGGQMQIHALRQGWSESVSTIKNFKYDHAKIREVAAHMIMVHELPFNFMEHELFNLLMKTATPYYQKISQVISESDCVSAYEIEKKRLKETLKGIGRVGVTTYLWKSAQQIQYMVLTCQFVDANWKLQKRNLNFYDVPPPHTGTAVHDALYNCFVEWGIENKVCTITVDNASYNDSAVKSLKRNPTFQRRLPLSGKLFHVRCCAHFINLLVQDGLPYIGSIIEKVRESVKHIAASQTRLIQFSDIAKQLQLPKKKLILDCCTRWNATHDMLATALEFRDVFPRYQERDSTYSNLPTDEDWNKVNDVCQFLEILKDVIEIISGTEYPTSNLFLPELWRIKEMLDEKSFCAQEEDMRLMACAMKLKLDKYWGECNLLISIAAVLDPRNKMKLIEFCCPEIYSCGEDYAHIDTVRKGLYELYDEYVAIHMTEALSRTNQGDEGGSSSNQFVRTAKRKSSGRSEFDMFIRSIQSCKSELDVYLEESVLICDESVSSQFDALDWWRVNNLKFRILSKMACDILSIPMSTVASESAFSANGRVIDPFSQSLSTETEQVLLCGGDWYRGYYGIKRKSKTKEDTMEILLP